MDITAQFNKLTALIKNIDGGRMRACMHCIFLNYVMLSKNKLSVWSRFCSFKIDRPVLFKIYVEVLEKNLSTILHYTLN